jgi:sodium pump decarboxylase gamma subunit
MTDFQSGLWVSLIGLTITFVALGVFIGVIVLLKKLFPYKPETEKAEEEAEETMAMAESTDDDDASVAAAVAAITYLRSQKKGQLGA